MPAMPSFWSRFGMSCALVLLATTAPATRLQDNFFGSDVRGAERAWVVGNFGSVFTTADAGTTWTRQGSGTKLPLFSISFADDTHGWIVGQGGLIRRTTDGGNTWVAQTSPVEGGKHLFKVAALDRNTAWAVGDWGAIAVTLDGGETWLDRSLGVLDVEASDTAQGALQIVTDDVILYDVSFVDGRHGAIAGEFGTILMTTDGGASWRRTTTGTDKTFFGVHVASATEAWAVGIDGILMRTEDAGENWIVQRGIVERGDLGELNFQDAMNNPGLYAVRVEGKRGVVVGDTGMLFVSNDRGRTWARREFPGKDRLIWLRDVSLTSSGTGVLVGAEGFTAIVDDGEIVGRGGVRASAPVAN